MLFQKPQFNGTKLISKEVERKRKITEDILNFTGVRNEIMIGRQVLRTKMQKLERQIEATE